MPIADPTDPKDIYVDDLQRRLEAAKAEILTLRAALAQQWQPFATAPTDGTIVLVAWIKRDQCKHGASYSWEREPDLAKFWVEDKEPHWRLQPWSEPIEVDTEDGMGFKTYANPPTHWAPIPGLPPDELVDVAPTHPPRS